MYPKLFTPDTESTTDQSNKTQNTEPKFSLVNQWVYRGCFQHQWLRGRELYHWKVYPKGSDDSGNLHPWSSLHNLESGPQSCDLPATRLLRSPALAVLTASISLGRVIETRLNSAFSDLSPLFASWILMLPPRWTVLTRRNLLCDTSSSGAKGNEEGPGTPQFP